MSARRVCAVAGCPTRLSTYNTGDRCFAHTPDLVDKLHAELEREEQRRERAERRKARRELAKADVMSDEFLVGLGDLELRALASDPYFGADQESA